MQDSYKVEGPACKTRIVQGLLKENATAAPWILDPTAADARVRGGPRRELGSRVHGGPSPRGTPRLIWVVRKRSDGQGRVRACSCGACTGEVTRTAACGGDSPTLALGGAPGHQNVHKLVHYIAGAHALVTGSLGG
jgi:hypothetical protein